MVTILNGVDTLPLRQIALQIAVQTNHFYRGDFKIVIASEINNDMTGLTVDDDVSVFYKNGLVFRTNGGHADKLFELEGGQAIYEEALELRDRIIDQIDSNYYRNEYANVPLDYGVQFDNVWPDPRDDESLEIEEDYNRLLTNCRESFLDNLVISGSFSTYVIESLREDLGSENVHVINMKRNPSVAYFLSDLHDGSTDSVVGNQHPYVKGVRLHDSLLTSNTLQTLKYVTTVKFEDYLKHGKFVYNNHTIKLPQRLARHNLLITKYEFENCPVCDSRKMDKWNARLLNYNFKTAMLELDREGEGMIDMSDEPELNETSLLIPSNLYGNLGYHPLTCDQILAPQK